MTLLKIWCVGRYYGFLVDLVEGEGELVHLVVRCQGDVPYK